MTEKNQFISIPKAAEKCGVDRRTMWRWVKSNKVPSFVTPGGHHRILLTDIERLLKQDGSSKNSYKNEATILIVDDDKSVRKTLKQRLRLQNYNVETAPDGFKAGIKVQALKPDLIILDLMMEGIDGFEVCRTIRGDDSLRDIKIMIMTGFDTLENKNRALQEGADDYLPKHVDYKTLIEKIQTLLTRQVHH